MSPADRPLNGHAAPPAEQRPTANPEAALDAYSQVVTGVARTLLQTVASLDIRRRVRGGQAPAGAGSAVALTPDGYLITSAHVIEHATSGTATFVDGARHPFEIVGADRLSDLAVVRITAPDLPAAALGDADLLQIGQLVVAVGSPLGYGGSVSAGVVSGLGRSLATRDGPNTRLVEHVIQTDAALHPGNSGGALADGQGRVVGINTALVGPFVGQGLGLAVPINETTRRIIAALMHDGRVRRAYLGVAGGTRPVPPRAAEQSGHHAGIEILSVVTDSPAAQAGLRPEDIIVAVDGQPVDRVGLLQELLSEERIGRTIPVEVVRGGRLLTVAVHPVELTAG